MADLGCGGAGHFIVPAARLVGNNTVVYGVDILKSALRAVITKGRLEGVNNIKPVWSDLEVVGATRIPEGSLDFALIINNLFQTKKPENFLREAMRLIKKTGKILVIDWDQSAPYFGPPLDSRVKKEQVKKIAADLKLKLIDEFMAGTYHYGLVFNK